MDYALIAESQINKLLKIKEVFIPTDNLKYYMGVDFAK
jgi:hypothetical protein